MWLLRTLSKINQIGRKFIQFIIDNKQKDDNIDI